MVFHGVEYWNDNGIIHNFKIWDTSKTTIHDYLHLETELKLEWMREHGQHVPLRMMVDVSKVGYIPTELFLTYNHPAAQNTAAMPSRYIAYLTDHITHKLLFHRVAKAGGDEWQKYRQIFAPNKILSAQEWLYTVSKPIEFEPLAIAR